MNTLIARLPDGRTVTRKTERDYRFLVCAFYDGKWHPYRWSTRQDLADQAAKEAKHFHEQVAVVTPEVLHKTRRRSVHSVTPRRQIDRCTACGRPCSRHYNLCYACRGGDSTIGLKPGHWSA